MTLTEVQDPDNINFDWNGAIPFFIHDGQIYYGKPDERHEHIIERLIGELSYDNMKDWEMMTNKDDNISGYYFPSEQGVWFYNWWKIPENEKRQILAELSHTLPHVKP